MKSAVPFREASTDLRHDHVTHREVEARMDGVDVPNCPVVSHVPDLRSCRQAGNLILMTTFVMTTIVLTRMSWVGQAWAATEPGSGPARLRSRGAAGPARCGSRPA